jgi:hypothetical protein
VLLTGDQLRAGDVCAPGSSGRRNTADPTTVVTDPVKTDTVHGVDRYGLGMRTGRDPVVHSAVRADARVTVTRRAGREPAPRRRARPGQARRPARRPAAGRRLPGCGRCRRRVPAGRAHGAARGVPRPRAAPGRLGRYRRHHYRPRATARRDRDPAARDPDAAGPTPRVTRHERGPAASGPGLHPAAVRDQRGAGHRPARRRGPVDPSRGSTARAWPRPAPPPRPLSWPGRSWSSCATAVPALSRWSPSGWPARGGCGTSARLARPARRGHRLRHRPPGSGRSRSHNLLKSRKYVMLPAAGSARHG